MDYCNVWEADGSRHSCKKCDTVFARKVRSVGIKYTYGREQFHGPTIKEQNEQQWKEWEKQGIADDISPVGERWV